MALPRPNNTDTPLHAPHQLQYRHLATDDLFGSRMKFVTHGGIHHGHIDRDEDDKRDPRITNPLIFNDHDRTRSRYHSRFSPPPFVITAGTTILYLVTQVPGGGRV